MLRIRTCLYSTSQDHQMAQWRKRSKGKRRKRNDGKRLEWGNRTLPHTVTTESYLQYNTIHKAIVVHYQQLEQRHIHSHQVEACLVTWHTWSDAINTATSLRTKTTSTVGLDRYHAGAWYPILSATAIPISILGCTNVFVLKMRFCAGCAGAGYICMRSICAKIWYRLETIGVCCKIVDCWDR